MIDMGNEGPRFDETVVDSEQDGREVKANFGLKVFLTTLSDCGVVLKEFPTAGMTDPSKKKVE
ncbi:MAG: hypothetical protein AAF939_01385 [Planctomycetota bacterium]